RDGAGRLGARLLPQISESPAGLYRRVVECRELEGSREALRKVNGTWLKHAPRWWIMLQLPHLRTHCTRILLELYQADRSQDRRLAGRRTGVSKIAESYIQ